MAIKVNEGSIAEDAGMTVDDFLVRIDDNSTAGLTHLQVQDLIIDAGNTFVLAVRRGKLPQYFTESENEDNEGSTLEDTKGETEDRTAEFETVETTSERGFERDSYQADREEDGEREQDQKDNQEKEFKMLQPTPEPEEFLTPEEREERRMEQEKMDKKQKIVHWNNIWPWGDHVGRRIYRDSNTHLVASKVIETKKINFLKYQPPPQTLDHPKHSEVYRLEPPSRGVQSRQGKAMAEEDYYAQIQKNSQEDVAQQTTG